MARLVDADALKAIRFHDFPYSQIVPTDCDTDDKVSAYKSGWNDAIDAIVESAPAVDAIEVVRCKDCKYYWKNCPTDKTLTSTLNAVCLASPKDDAFCSEGERREDANN